MSGKKIIAKIIDSLPDGAEQSVCTCGGLEGLISRLPDNSEIEEISLIFRALADEKRINILSMLEIQPLCVCIIRAVLDVSDSRLSYHLSILKKAGLITGEQKGTWITYSLTEKGKKWFFSCKQNME
ncbi:MAG: winged helix-turn-helix transcriptional regulator [Methanomicrobiaceae archaeon]|nr:winged helix-turn-helix transcriptional regulator [Methanomicrobiaceae archaeon]